MARIPPSLDPRRSIRARIALSFGGVALLFAAAGGLYVGHRQEAELGAQIGAGFEQLAFHFGSDLARNVDERHDDLVFAASLGSFRGAGEGGAVEREREHLATLQGAHPEFAWIGFADAQGRVQAATGRVLEGADVSDREWFAHGRAGSHFGDMHDAPQLLRALLPRRLGEAPRLIDVAVPVTGLDGTPRGVLGAHLSDAWVRGRFAALKRGAEGLRAVEVMLVSADGRVLVSDGAAPPGMRITIPRPAQAHSGGFASLAMEGGRTYLVGYQRVAAHDAFSGFGWTVVARQDAALALQPAARARDAAFVIALCLGLLFTGLGWLIAARIGRPLERITAAAARLRADHDAELPAQGRRDELGMLAATLRSLVQGLRHDESLIREREAELANIVETMVEGVAIFDAQGRITMVNAASERILGASREAIVGCSYTDVPWRRHRPGGGALAPQDHPFARMLAGAERIEGEELEIITAEGRGTTVQVNAAAIRDEGGAFAGMVATYADVTERKRAEAQARGAQERLDRALEASKVALFEVDVDGGTVYLSESWSLMRGGPAEPTRTTMTALIDLTHPDEREHLWSLARAVLRGDRAAYEAEHRVRSVDGDWIWIISRARILERAADGRVRRVVGTNMDVTERKRAEQRIHYLNTRDALTDLSNRALFADRLEDAVEAARRASGRLALLAVGLDRFTAINDSLGRDFGDEVLKGVAARITASVGVEEVVARPGGDEFLVLLARVESPEQARSAAEAMRAAVASPLRVGGRDAVVTMSVGIALYPEDGETAGMLLRNAGTALNVAKEEGGDCARFFAPRMNVAARARFETEAELRRALERDEFVLHFQPQVDLATHAVVGWEALVRWRHPERGLLPPGQFLPIAEASGLIVPLGEHVLLKACRQSAAWKQAGMQARIAINVAAQQFRHPGFMKSVRAAFASTGIDPGLLELEIVENALIGHELDAVFEALGSAGVELAIDDFGTGYSSLSYLKRLPIDTVKIDQSFVRDVPASPEACAIVHAVIAMAHGLGLRVIAEGIEHPAQLEFLRQGACDRGQGYLFGHPEPPEHWARDAGNVYPLKRSEAR